MITFDRIEIDQSTKTVMNETDVANVFQTHPWLEFLKDVHYVEPVQAKVKSNGRFLGTFTGAIINKYGIKILGSPFRRWQTYFMGFNLMPGAPKNDILKAFPKFVFEDLKCHYLEVIDPNLAPSDWEGLTYRFENLHYYGIDLSISEEQLFKNINPKARNSIRQSIRKNVVVEEANDYAFADDYYAQYKNVLERHSLTPTFSQDSVRKLIEYLRSSGNLLLLRAKNSDGLCIATAIFLIYKKTAVVWGAASWREYQSLRPNEPLVWYGMKYLKAHGAQILHYGGKAENFKKKLGATEVQLYRLMLAKNFILGNMLYFLQSPKNESLRNWFLRSIKN